MPLARRNIEKVIPDSSNLQIVVGDIYQGIAEEQVDRVVLDVPEPWQAVPGVGDALILGGIMISFLPTILQVHQLVMELQRDGRFQMIEMVETLLRPWQVTERSVRPAHRMVAHSGFLTTAVRCQPRVVGTVANPSLPSNVLPDSDSGSDLEPDLESDADPDSDSE